MPRYDLLVTVVMSGPYAPSLRSVHDTSEFPELNEPSGWVPGRLGGIWPVVAGLGVLGVALGTAEVLQLLHLAA